MELITKKISSFGKDRGSIKPDHRGKTARMLAAEKGYLGIVSLLLEKGSDINATNADGETSLMMAVKAGHKDVVELLLKNKADIKVKDAYGDTVLIHAIKSKHKEIEEILLENGS